jgi:hypothetical protein
LPSRASCAPSNSALRAFGHRRELARRLFLLLEAQPGHEVRLGFREAL